MATGISNADFPLEVFTLIWLDGSINESENKETQHDLRQLSAEFRTFDQREQCESYLQALSNTDRVVLIVSGRLGREIVPRVHMIEQIDSIYVYCFDRNASKEWARHYSKVKGVLTKKDELIRLIRHRYRKDFEQPLYINVQRDDLDHRFVYSQLLIECLLHLKLDPTLERSFLDLCTCECANDDTQIKLLEEFDENYRAESSVRWLVRAKFLSKAIAKAHHTRDIDSLYNCCFFLRDVHAQLLTQSCPSSIRVYHTHLMTIEQVDELKNSIGQLMSIDTFLPATVQRDPLPLPVEQEDRLETVLFEIEVGPSDAETHSFGYFNKESQIIFMIGSIFRVENCYREEDTWICEISLSSRNDPELKAIFERIEEEDGNSQTDVHAFGNLLARMSHFDDAENYYQRTLDELPMNEEDKYICYRNLGNIAYLKVDYERSLEYHSKSLQIQEVLLSADDPSIADSHNCLGVVYFDQHEYKRAMECYEKALNILKLTSDENRRKRVLCLNNVSLVHRTMKDYPTALVCYIEALDIERKYFADDHANLGQTYHNIGALYWCCGFDDRAMEYYHLALETKGKYLPLKDRLIGMTLENIGLLHENKGNFAEACNYYLEAATNYTQSSVVSDVHDEQIKKSILRVSSQPTLETRF